MRQAVKRLWGTQLLCLQAGSRLNLTVSSDGKGQRLLRQGLPGHANTPGSCLKHSARQWQAVHLAPLLTACFEVAVDRHKVTLQQPRCWTQMLTHLTV